MSVPSMPVTFDVHSLEQRFRLRPTNANAAPLAVSDVPDVRLYMESLGLEYLQQCSYARLPQAVLSLLGARDANRPALDQLGRALMQSGGQPSDTCRLVYCNDFEPAVFARTALQAGELFGVLACHVMLQRDAPADDATVWPIEAQPLIYAGPALAFCARAAANVFRFMRNARLTGRAANVAARQVWVEGRPYMALEAVESVSAGTELLLDFGAEKTACLLRRNLASMGLASHALHARLLELRREFARAQVDEPEWPEHGVTGPVDVVLSRNRALFDCPTLECARVYELALRRKLHVRRDPSPPTDRPAYAHALHDANWCDAFGRAVVQLPRPAPQLGRWSAADSHAAYCHLVEAAQAHAHCDALAAKRLDLLHHPLRWLVVPCVDVFCVVATKPIARLRPVVACTGTLWPDDASRCDFDVMWPVVGAPLPVAATPNCTAQIVWDEARAAPVHTLVTSTAVRAGDILVCQDTLRSAGDYELALQLQHLKYWYRALGRVLQLEAELARRDVAVPPCTPLVTSYAPDMDSVWERDETLYPPGAIDFDAHNVRAPLAITEARVTAHGEREYRVQWRGLDPSWNAWVPESDATLRHSELAFREGAKPAAEHQWNAQLVSALGPQMLPQSPAREADMAAVMTSDEDRAPSPYKRARASRGNGDAPPPVAAAERGAHEPAYLDRLLVALAQNGDHHHHHHDDAGGDDVGKRGAREGPAAAAVAGAPADNLDAKRPRLAERGPAAVQELHDGNGSSRNSREMLREYLRRVDAIIAHATAERERLVAALESMHHEPPQ